MISGEFKSPWSSTSTSEIMSSPLVAVSNLVSSRSTRCTSCCYCGWRHCGFCAKHVFCIRVALVSLSLIDIATMCWFIYATWHTSSQIVNCCGVSHDAHSPNINDTRSADAYSECTRLNYENLIVSDYSRFIFNTKRFHAPSWDSFASMLTYYDMNVSVNPNTGGCVVNHYDCFNDTVRACALDAYPRNRSFARNVTRSLESMCRQPISDTAKLYVIAGVVGVALLKMVLIAIAMCTKLCRDELKPRNEALHNLKNPKLFPLFAGIEKVKHSAYAKMAAADDEEESKRYRCVYGCCVCVKYGVWLMVFVWRVCVWMLRTSYLLMIFTLSLFCSVELYFVHNSPVLGVDALDFCAEAAQEESCYVGQKECGAIEWIVLPHVAAFFVPRVLTLSVSYLACLGRIVEQCAVCKLQDMIRSDDRRLVKDLHINRLPSASGTDQQLVGQGNL